ncbi:MAG TPA: hypothetical protein VMT22_17085 [Terriglobales bacterium]|nr:hypothetical protein [Terriglobales bacterium]
MNSSLWCADRATHIKIVAVSLVMAAMVVVVVGSGVRITDTNSTSARNYADPGVIKAGQPISLSTVDVSTIR